MDSIANEECDFVFDFNNPGWTNDREINLMYLKNCQDYANNALAARGNVFLNEILDLLGQPRTKAGAIIGWLYPSTSEVGFIEFRLGYDKNDNDPNVAVYITTQGVIYDKIEG